MRQSPSCSLPWSLFASKSIPRGSCWWFVFPLNYHENCRKLLKTRSPVTTCWTSVRLTRQALHYCHIPFPMWIAPKRGISRLAPALWAGVVLSLSACLVEDVALLKEIRNVEVLLYQGDTQGPVAGARAGPSRNVRFSCVRNFAEG